MHSPVQNGNYCVHPDSPTSTNDEKTNAAAYYLNNAPFVQQISTPLKTDILKHEQPQQTCQTYRLRNIFMVVCGGDRSECIPVGSKEESPDQKSIELQHAKQKHDSANDDADDMMLLRSLVFNPRQIDLLTARTGVATQVVQKEKKIFNCQLTIGFSLTLLWIACLILV